MVRSEKVSTAEDSTVTSRPSGRVVFDEAGRGSWEWQVATGVFQQVISDEQLQRFERNVLSLAQSEPVTTCTMDLSWQLRTGPTPAFKSEPKRRGFLSRWLAKS